MAKNLGREFAAMTEDERRAFELQQARDQDASAGELDLEDPRRHPRLDDDIVAPDGNRPEGD